MSGGITPALNVRFSKQPTSALGRDHSSASSSFREANLERRLSGDEFEEASVATRPRPAGRALSKRPFPATPGPVESCRRYAKISTEMHRRQQKKTVLRNTVLLKFASGLLARQLSSCFPVLTRRTHSIIQDYVLERLGARPSFIRLPHRKLLSSHVFLLIVREKDLFSVVWLRRKPKHPTISKGARTPHKRVYSSPLS